MKNIAFAGLGAMGLPMARNLLRAGYPVRGTDVNPASLQALGQDGGTAAQDAAAACRGADFLILMVVNAEQAEQVLFVQGGLDALPADATVCLMATCPPGAVQAIAGKVMATGRRFVDAPVSGGVVGAVQGSLTVMAACDDATFAHAQPVLSVVGGRVFQVGQQAGQGATVKTVNQLLCGVHIAVVAEAFSLAAKAGVQLDVLLDIMGGSSASSWMLKDRGPRMLQTEPEVTSAVDIFVKDLGIVLQAGREMKSALPLAAVAHQMFLASSGCGDGRADDSQVIRSYHRLNGLQP
jgi:putative dehydrogenase